MKKIMSIGLVILLSMSVGCAKGGTPAAASPKSSDEVVEKVAAPVAEPSDEGSTDLDLSDEDFVAFFKALFSYTESEYDAFNQNVKLSYVGYFDNLEAYRKGIEAGLGKYLSQDVMKKLKSQNVKLDIDLPKKVLINDYVVEASGKVEKVEIESTRALDDSMVYGIAVTTTNTIQPYNDFIKYYGWSDELGYYALKGAGVNVTELGKSVDNLETYVFANKVNMIDEMKIVSHYWIQVKADPAGPSGYVVEGIKGAGSFEMDYNNKQILENNQSIDRVPYYEETTDSQNKVIVKFITALMNAPKETFYYYDKVLGGSFDQFNSFWVDLNLASTMSINEKTYKDAFDKTMNPYKDNIVELTVDDKNIVLSPSVYSTKLQPAFVVTVPVKTLLKNNSVVYYNYKYLVSTEDDKVEAIRFIKMDTITEADYVAGSAALEVDATDEEAPAPSDEK